jgi:hypothetical protein
MEKELAGLLAQFESRRDRLLLAVAGPPGAGKTRLVDTILRPLPLRVVSPVAIERVLALGSPEEADRLADETAEDLVSRGISFCLVIELTDAELDYLRQVRAHDYAILLVFLGLTRRGLSFPNLGQLLKFTEHAFLFDEGRFVAELQGTRVIRHGDYRPRWWTRLRR